MTCGYKTENNRRVLRACYFYVLHLIGYPDAGRGELAGLPVSFQNVKKP